MKKIVTITYTKHLFDNQIERNERMKTTIHTHEFLNNRRVKGKQENTLRQMKTHHTKVM